MPRIASTRRSSAARKVARQTRGTLRKRRRFLRSKYSLPAEFCVPDYSGPAPLRLAATAAKRAGVTGRVRFERGDLFEADLRPASVVTLYLFESLNRRLLPKLLAELRAGSRIVSHKFTFAGDWQPEKTVMVGDSAIFLWTVPAGGARPAAG